MNQTLDRIKEQAHRAVGYINYLEHHIPSILQAAYAARVDSDEHRIIVFAERRKRSRQLASLPPASDFVHVVTEFTNTISSILDDILRACHLNGPFKARFPIFDAADDYATLGEAMIDGISDAAKAVIKKAQPYNLETSAHAHPLWMLKEIQKAAKSYRLFLRYTATSVVLLDNGYSHTVTLGPNTLKDAEVLRLENSRVYVNAELSGSIAFDETLSSHAHNEIVPSVINSIYTYIIRDIVRKIWSEYAV